MPTIYRQSRIDAKSYPPILRLRGRQTTVSKGKATSRATPPYGARNPVPASVTAQPALIPAATFPFGNLKLTKLSVWLGTE